ncbi:CheW protein [Pirellula staleyi DSM 6068]|uniref:CheW protein n=1 Tax=Pirellula staleyi (strain ATCC 27377 / DSM 6068 / ICPB 4128) TaxID=530564 RepID=D2QXS8_PIRSD|nr:chemotaxis protein CheW [Pirellula staleyi]ADB18005.1 CheW protein [Pirellula staleyi DSM 6068]
MESNVQLCTFRVDDQLYGVEVHEVQEVLKSQPMTRIPLAPPYAQGLINLRGQLVLAIDLRKRLGLSTAKSDVPSMNVVVRSGDESVSLLVDRIGDVLTMDKSEFEPPPPNVTGSSRQLIAGAYKLQQELLLVLQTSTTLNFAAN